MSCDYQKFITRDACDITSLGDLDVVSGLNEIELELMRDD